MAYTYEQLVKAYTAVHGGIEPTGEAASQLRLLTNASFTDTQRMNYILNSADQSTSVAVLSYQFFTGKAPSAQGMDYLLKSGATNLNSETYAKFNLENRFMNFATNLALEGEGKAAFAANYGSMTYAQYVASIYESIIGKAQATAAGLNPEQTILDIIARQDLILQSARNNGVIGPNATAAEIDLALKAATAAYLLAEGIKADVGVYAGATNNFMVGVATGTAKYDTNILTTHAPTQGSSSTGVGQAVDTPPAFEELPGAPAPAPEPQGPSNQAFTLTVGNDTFTGGAGADTFEGTPLTFGYGDELDGGAGEDTLTITATGGQRVDSLPNNSVTNIETYNLNNDGEIYSNTYQWTGLKQVNITSVGETGVFTADGVNVNATVTQQGAGEVAVHRAKDVTITATGATTGQISLGGSGSIHGAVKIDRETTGAVSAGAIEVNGGTTVEIRQHATNAANSTQTNGAVTVNGGEATTSVTVKADKAVTANVGTAGVAANSVTISDTFTGEAATAGTITKASVEGFTTLSFNGTALTDLSVAHGSGNIVIDNSGLLAPTNKTLNLKISGHTGGILDDADVYETLNVTTGAVASTLANITFGNLETLNIDGATGLTLTAATGLSHLETVKISGAAGLTADLSGGTVTSVDASGTTGVNTLKIDASKASFAGGSGADAITLTSATISHDVKLGDGNDTLTVASGTTKVDAVVSGGAGVDTLIISGDDAAALSLQSTVQFTDFEVLQLTSTTAKQAIALDQVALSLGGTVRVTGGEELALNGSGNLGTLELTGAGISYMLNDSTWSGGANDSLTLKLTQGSAAGVAFASDGINAAGIETVNIVNTDTRSSPSGSFNNSVSWLGDDVKTITVSGDAGLTLTATSSELTKVDASGITKGGFTWTAGYISTPLEITGSATGVNTIDLTNVWSNFTYVGGSGSDNITYAGGLNTLDLGGGADHVTVTRAPMDAGLDITAITGFGQDDKLTLGLGGPPASVTTLVELQGQNSVADYLAQAALLNDATKLQWFQYGDDTYVVQDRSPNNTLASGVDIAIKLVGVADLSGWGISNATLTYGAPI